MKKPSAPNLVARLPPPLLKKLDRAAKAADRTRSAEVRVRLEQSLKTARTGVNA